MFKVLFRTLASTNLIKQEVAKLNKTAGKGNDNKRALPDVLKIEVYIHNHNFYKLVGKYYLEAKSIGKNTSICLYQTPL